MIYLTIVTSVLSIILFCIILFRKKQQVASIESIKNFDSYISVLIYHMSKAFNIIYKDRILIYSIEGTKHTERDIDLISRDYCSLVLKMLGKSLTEQFIILYGDKKTLLFNILEYFNSKYEDDSIRQSSIDSMVNNVNV